MTRASTTSRRPARGTDRHRTRFRRARGASSTPTPRSSVHPPTRLLRRAAVFLDIAGNRQDLIGPPPA
jgi:hypothetical protein